MLPFLLLFGLQSAYSQSFKVIGYLPQHRLDGLDNLEFSRLTHINIAFANPDAQGNLSGDSVDIASAVTCAPSMR